MVMLLRGAQSLKLIYTLILVSCFCVAIIFIYNITTEDPNQALHPISLGYVMGKLQKINVDYKNNVFYSVRTCYKNYRTRLLLLMLTWLQAVDKDQVSDKAIPSGNLVSGPRPHHLAIS